MSKFQDIISNLQFAHSLWLNELSHAEVELAIMSNRLDLLETSNTIPNDQEGTKVISSEIEQLLLAAKFIKQTVLEHVGRIYNLSKLNGQLDKVSNSVHDDTKERLDQFRIHFDQVRQKFYSMIPIEDQI